MLSRTEEATLAERRIFPVELPGHTECRRVVVTGVGALSPLGVGVEESWNRCISGESGIQLITRFDVSQLETQIAGVVPPFNRHHHDSRPKINMENIDECLKKDFN